MLLDDKLTKLRRHFRKNKWDGLILFQGPVENTFLHYLLLDSPDRAIAVITAERFILYVSPLEQPRIRQRHKNSCVEVMGITEEPGKLLGRLGLCTVGYQADLITVKQFRLLKKIGYSLQEASQDLAKLRAVKLPEEVQRIKKACAIADAIFRRWSADVDCSGTEQQAKDLLLSLIEKSKVVPSFDPIVASGPQAALPHAFPKGRLRKGFCVVDLGVVYQGYCSDMTRTVFLGKPSRKDQEIYGKLLSAQEKTISRMRKVRTCKALDAFAKRELGHLARHFTHALGHGVGTAVHEFPLISGRSKHALAEGYVVTVEPGAYILSKFGMRIEDVIHIKDGKPVVLTRSPKTLAVL